MEERNKELMNERKQRERSEKKEKGETNQM